MKDIVNCPCCPDYFYSTSKKTKLDKLLKSEKDYFKNLQQIEREAYQELQEASKLQRIRFIWKANEFYRKYLGET